MLAHFRLFFSLISGWESYMLHHWGCVKLSLSLQASKITLVDIRLICIQYFKHQMDISMLSTQVILLSSLVVLLMHCSVIYKRKLSTCIQVWISIMQIIMLNQISSSFFLIDSCIINKLFMCVSVGCSFIGDTHLSVDKPLEFCEFKRIAYFWFCNQSQ